MKLAYYPGCSLESSSESYDDSVKALCAALDIQLAPIDDWNCCGATEAATINQLAGHALVARNLARVEPDCEQVVAPCAACFLNLKKTDKVLATDKRIGRDVATALAAGGLTYKPGSLTVRHLHEVIHDAVGKDRLIERMRRPLYGLRIAPYYGCQLVRPYPGGDDPEYPRQMDDLLRWLGATVVDFPLKSHCCGGHMTQISEDMSNELLRRLLHNAAKYDADLMACMCPMCQLNLDAYQGRVNDAFGTSFSMPILFLTQVIGIALGIDAKQLGIGKELVAAMPVIDRKVVGKAPEKKRRRRRTRSQELRLPMPGGSAS